MVQCGLNLYRGHAYFVGINAKPLDGILESHHRYQRQTASFFTMVAVGEFAEISACTVIAAYQRSLITAPELGKSLPSSASALPFRLSPEAHPLIQPFLLSVNPTYFQSTLTFSQPYLLSASPPGPAFRAAYATSLRVPRTR